MNSEYLIIKRTEDGMDVVRNDDESIRILNFDDTMKYMVGDEHDTAFIIPYDIYKFCTSTRSDWYQLILQGIKEHPHYYCITLEISFGVTVINHRAEYVLSKDNKFVDIDKPVITKYYKTIDEIITSIIPDTIFKDADEISKVFKAQGYSIDSSRFFISEFNDGEYKHIMPL